MTATSFFVDTSSKVDLFYENNDHISILIDIENDSDISFSDAEMFTFALQLFYIK